MCLQLVEKIIKKPEGIIEDVLVDFVVLDFKEDEKVPLILSMPFMYTAKSIIDVYERTLTLRVGED